MLSESEKIKKAIQKVAAEEIQRDTASCWRVYKGIVTSAPNGTTCKVRLIGDTTEFSLPYAANLSDLTVGSAVLIGVAYSTDKSLANAVVWSDVKFAMSNTVPDTMTHTLTLNNATTTNKKLTLPINTNIYRITQITLVNLDIYSGSFGAAALLLYESDDGLYLYGNVGYYSAITSGATTEITIGAPNTVWDNNANISVTVNYVKK